MAYFLSCTISILENFQKQRLQWICIDLGARIPYSLSRPTLIWICRKIVNFDIAWWKTRTCEVSINLPILCDLCFCHIECMHVYMICSTCRKFERLWAWNNGPINRKWPCSCWAYSWYWPFRSPTKSFWAKSIRQIKSGSSQWLTW